MLYRFQSKEAPDVLMLSDLTEKIFDIIGKKNVEKQGIFLVEQLTDAIQKLEAAIEQDDKIRRDESNVSTIEPQEFSQENVRLGQRAYPFLELLRKARVTQKVVTWSV